MSKASKARRASYRAYAREQDALGWSWKRQGSGQAIPECRPEDMGQAHIMHKVAEGAQHMTAAQSFSAFRAGDQAFMTGEAGGLFPSHLGYSVYIKRMYAAGCKKRASKPSIAELVERAALVAQQQAQLVALCEANGLVATDSNLAMFEELLANEKRKNQAATNGIK